MYEEVLSVLLEDGALTEKNSAGSNCIAGNKALPEKRLNFEAKLRAKLLQKNRKTLQEDARAVPM